MSPEKPPKFRKKLPIFRKKPRNLEKTIKIFFIYVRLTP